MMVFVSLLVHGWSEGDLVVRLRIGHALFQECSDVVGGIDSETSALGGDYLKCYVAIFGLARFADSFDKALPSEGTPEKVGATQGIDTVQGDAALAQQSRQSNDLVEDLLLLLCVHLFVDAGARKQRPA